MILPLPMRVQAVDVNCTAGPSHTPVDYSVKCYSIVAAQGGPAGTGTGPDLPRDGMVTFDVALPRGALGLQMRAVDLSDRSPPQFAPFPSFDIAGSAPLENGLAMCYGSERPHLLSSVGVSGFTSQCTTLSGGMSVLAWPDAESVSSVAGAVVTAANEFHLNFHRLAKSNVTGSSGGTAGWSHGLSGEISEVPAGFVGRTMVYYSGEGLNAAVDGWGTTLRQAYKTTKNDAEDLFLQTVSMWTDNVRRHFPRPRGVCARACGCVEWFRQYVQALSLPSRALTGKRYG